MTPEQIKTKLKARIRKAVKEHGTEIELSKKLGMNRTYIHRGLGTGGIEYLTKIINKIEAMEAKAHEPS